MTFVFQSPDPRFQFGSVRSQGYGLQNVVLSLCVPTKHGQYDCSIVVVHGVLRIEADGLRIVVESALKLLQGVVGSAEDGVRSCALRIET